MKMLLIGFNVILLLCGLCWGRTVKTPVFSNTYTTRGTLYIPYAEIEEPFYAWFDGSNGRSRIDYYGDMVKTYQLSTEGPYGSSIKIAPVTTENEINKQTCLQVNGTKETKILPQTIIPDTTGMECNGEEMIFGIMAEKWKFTEVIEEKKNEYTLWIRYVKSSKQPKLKEPVPIKYEMRGFNTLLGSHYDHYYLTYDYYDFEVPNDNVFQVDKNSSCVSFPGPGIDHVYTFNPMHEFIHNYDHHVNNIFDEFKTQHNKSYDNELEHHKRKIQFKHNLRYIHSFNRAGLSFQLKMNHLADRFNEELRHLYGKQYTKPSEKSTEGLLPFEHNVAKEKDDLPETWDWRISGAVTPVKDQSVCGSCWSFGSTGAVEGAYFMKHKRLVRLSQQALIDCSWGFGNNGCDGGEDFRSYQWIMKHGGLPTEDEYGGYLGQDGLCHIDNVAKVAKLKGFVNVKANDLDALKLAIFKHGPVSVAIDASHKTFSFYSNGVYYEPSCGNTEENLDHAVLAVGYGTLNGQGYWLIKNSWSNYWGNDGYILMAQKNNNCGVMTAPTYAVAA
ncbi:digestive cysteine proteinase 1 [Copidosoma floridanum]|uniref:digestive cysteine proteinase 1 n=1 Tax=Copidosoma floridanum TaxID=29053 RepID=UPI0006C9D69C|nr:digestive cysteine proteinase 1 [Copidosoma floridanum]